jgi:potassium/hydrogen antiporter
MDRIDIANIALFAGSIMILLGIFSSLIAKRFGAPLVLVFLVLGMLLGEDGIGGLVFSDYQLTYVIGSLALAIILFDGGLRTKLSAFRGIIAPALLMATVGVVITAVLTGLVAVLVLPQLNFLEALLLGSIVASTDAAAVFFLLRGRPAAALARPLDARGRVGHQRSRGGVPDHHAGRTHRLGRRAGLGASRAARPAGGPRRSARRRQRARRGVAAQPHRHAGRPASAVRRGGRGVHLCAHLDPRRQRLLAAYLAGLVLANRPVRAYPSIVAFHDAATWLAQIGMFLVLGLLVTPSTLLHTPCRD